MKYLVVPDDEGKYMDKDNNRFNVIYGGFVVGPRASEFKQFESLEQALEYYGLFDSEELVTSLEEAIEAEHTEEPEQPQDEIEQEQEPEEEVVISNEENTTEEESEVEAPDNEEWL